jgi:hypothetical protein
MFCFAGLSSEDGRTGFTAITRITRYPAHSWFTQFQLKELFNVDTTEAMSDENVLSII